MKVQATVTFLFILGFMVSVSLSISPCSSVKTCEECVGKDSWFGLGKCRWCRRDNECHAAGAILTNDCKRSENIITDKSLCNVPLNKYDPNLSHKMLLLSSATYDNNDPQECLDNCMPLSHVKILRVVTKQCGSGDQCSAYVGVSDVEKAIVLSFRGTVDGDQVWHQIVSVLLDPKQSFQGGGKVQRYWKNAFEEVWYCLKSGFSQAR